MERDKPSSITSCVCVVYGGNITVVGVECICKGEGKKKSFFIFIFIEVQVSPSISDSKKSPL